MSVRAKMKCQSIEDFGEQKKVNLVAVNSGGDNSDNAQWSKWTPSGSVSLNITNPDASSQFEVGKSYFVDFTPAG